MKLFILNLSLSRNGGGIFTVIKELFQSRKFKDSDYTDMYFLGYLDKYSCVDSNLLPGNIKCFQVWFKGINKIFYSLKLKQYLSQEVSENDIIHLHSLWLYLSVLSTKLQKKKNIKKVVSTHGMLDKWALKNGNLKKKIALKLFENNNLNTADCIHALCEREYRDIRKIAPNVPIAIIPNGIYLPSSIKKATSNKVKKLLFISRIHPKKGLVNLLHAWAKLRPDNWKLIITGPDENNHLRELRDLATNLKLNEHIEFTGPKFGKDKEDLLLTSNAFILPSFSEGLPMSILEAWSFKLPVVMTPECNLSEGFDFNAAIKIEANPDSIAKGLEELFSMSDSQMSEMGNKGYKLVKESYTWDTVAQQMVQLYDWVLGKIENPDFIRLE